jgi:hypothetical protein
MTLDCSEDADFKIVAPGAMNEGCEGKFREKKDDQSYRVTIKEKLFSIPRLYGVWWIDAALRGAIDQLPLVNLNPKIEKIDEMMKSLKIDEKTL